MNRALKEAKNACLLLAKKYGVKKVVLFGSLVIGKYKRGSDIDLAVEGLKTESYIEALVEVERFTGMTFDIKLMEECKGFLRERITKEGKILYEG